MIQFNPIPVLLKLGPFTVYSFGFMLALSAFVFLVLVMKNSKKIMNPEKTYALLLSIIVFAILGARLAYIFVNFNEFSSFSELFMIWKGGLSGIGALLGGIFGVFIFSKINKLNFFELTDFIIPYVALSFAIGKIGCFLRGCCFGLPTSLPWGILYKDGSLASEVFSVPVHPVQIYQAIATLAIFFVLMEFNKLKSRKNGQTFFLFLSLFSLMRFFLDFVRYYPESNYVGNFTVFQIGYGILFIFSAIIFLLSVVQIIKRKL